MTPFDTWELLTYLKKRKDRHIAIMLDDLEVLLPRETHQKEFPLVRKMILDHFNDYHRQVFRVVAGIEVEGQTYQ